MANPRQRRKTRSGTHKAVQHSRHAKKLLKKQPPIRGPKVLQEAWDNHKTVRQNYEALGLVASLRPTTSGGAERPFHALTLEHPHSGADVSMEPQASSSSSNPRPVLDGVPKGYGRIVRDEAGNVVDVQLAEEDPIGEDAPADAPLEALPDPMQDEQLAPWVGLGSVPGSRRVDASESHVVQALEQMSTEDVRPKRFTSAGELAVLRRLVGKYNRDVEAMARDRKLNTDQRTPGELRRAIEKAGGFAELGSVS